MTEAITVSLQVYFLTFCIAIVIAAMISGLLVAMRKLFAKKEVAVAAGAVAVEKTAKVEKPEAVEKAEKAEKTE